MPDNDPTDTSDFGMPFRALLDHCEGNELAFSADHENQCIELKLYRQHALYHCSLRITNEERIFQIHVSYPVLAKDEKMRPAVLEFLTRANCGLVIGNFEMDLQDGEISYHVGHLIGNGQLEDDTIMGLVTTALATSDKYFPALMCLLFAGHTPEDAIFLVELDLQTEQAKDAPAASNPSSAGQKGDHDKMPDEPKPAKNKSDTSRKKGKNVQEASKPPENSTTQPNPEGDNSPPAPEGDQP